MSSLRLQGVGVDLADGPLFDDIHLQLRPGQRIALVGENGAGKSTLLRVAAGQLEPDRGTVRRSGSLVLLPQALPDQDGPPGSGGERQRRRLEVLMAEGADLLLLDEPTHHLDTEAMAWLEGWLRNSDAAVLLVAHDRAFLDAVATDTAFLERGRLRLEAGAYTEASARRESEDAAQGRRHRAQAARREALTAAVQREASRARSAGDFNPKRATGKPTLAAKNHAEATSRTLARRAKAMARRLEREPEEEKPYQDRRQLSFLAKPATPGPTEVLTAKGLVVQRAGRRIVDGLDLYLRRGERVALVGPNGVGKTTLLEVLSGARAADAGELRHGVGLTVAHVTQVSEPWAGGAESRAASRRSDSSTVGDVLRRVNPGLRDGDVWRVTAQVGVPSGPERQVAELSGGERRRLTLACVAAADAHLLVLDEPTHHLDLRAVEALEELLLGYQGTLLLASHDRRLVERIATQVWHFGEQGLLPEGLG